MLDPGIFEAQMMSGIIFGLSAAIGQEITFADGMVEQQNFGDFAPLNRYVDSRTALPGGARPSDDFHVYAVEWGEGLIRFLVDDRVHLTVTAEQ